MTCVRSYIALLALALAGSSIPAAVAQQPADTAGILTSKRGAVVSTSSIASDVGAGILAKGGNAVDAAVATAFALAVTHPEQKGAVRFQRGAIGRIGAGFLGFGIERAERALGFLQNLASAVLEQATEEIQVPLPHNTGALEVRFRFY